MNDAELIKWREQTDLPRIQALIDGHIGELTGDDGNGWTLDHTRLYCHVLACEELEKELKERQARMKEQEGRTELAVYLSLNKRFFLSQFDEYERHRREVHRLTDKLYRPESEWQKRESQNGVTDEQIERARQYPITNLLEVNRGGMARCISGEHEDKTPSMDCRNNFAYCHACGFTGDAIAVYQKIHGVTFPEAVRVLQ